MSITGEPNPPESSAPQARPNAGGELLERQPWAEITRAVVLALATMASAWCAYQSTRWNGVQTFRLAEASEAGRQSAINSIDGLQIRAFDGTMFLHYLDAHAQGQSILETMLDSRFRPELKAAMKVWLETDPFNDPNSPPHPFKMAEYELAEEAAAGRFSQVQKERLAEAQLANQTSDTYVLLTVMFASVLFFGGIAGTAHLSWLRNTLGGLATAFFVVTILYLLSMPMCQQ